MKKSFLKRAMAAAIAVPVALTQTVLWTSFAADSDAALKEITKDTFTNVDASAEITEIEANAVYEQYSNWNKEVYTALGDLQGTTYTIDTAALADSVSSDRWSVDFVQRLLTNSANAVVAFNADDVTITADVEYLAGMLGLKIKEDGVLNAADYTINGQVVIKIDTLGLYEGKTVSGTATMTVDGKAMTAAEVLAYAQDKVDAIAADAAEAGVDYSELIAYYNDTLANAQAKYDEAMAKNTSESYEASDCDDLIAQVKAAHADSERVQNLPNTVSEALAKENVASMFNAVMAQVNDAVAAGGYSVNVSPEDIEEVAYALSDIVVSGSVAAGAASAEGTAMMEDDLTADEEAALIAEINTMLDEGLEVDTITTYKVVEASADASVDGMNGSATLEVKRVIEITTTEIDDTTDPTETETETDPTETETETDPTETETETDPTETETETDPTETETDPTETETDPTETETETDPTETETETDPTETETETDPTETETETDPTETETETDPTETETETDPTETETQVAVEKVVEIEAYDDNFFFSHDENAFNAEYMIADGIITVTTTTTDADGNVLAVDETTEDIDYSLFTFGTSAEVGPVDGLTPAQVYAEVGTDYTAIELDVYYDGVLVEGTAVKVYIGVKGDANLDGAADANDASYVLQFAAEYGGGNTDAVLYTEGDTVLEYFAFFLAEVTDEDMFHDSTLLDSNDASYILQFAAISGSEDTPAAEIWAEILG